jgi:predicted amidohydrolase YtcJ
MLTLLPPLLLACTGSTDPADDVPVVASPKYELVVRAALLPASAPMYIAVQDGLVAEISPTPLDAGTLMDADVVTPGLVDAHAHPSGLGRALAELRLSDCKDFAEVQQRIRDASEGEGWLTGRGWDQNDWPDHEGFPTAAELDELVPDRPVALRRVDGHAVWLNSKALELSGITLETRAPEGGRILDGVLIDAAGGLLHDIPDPPVEEQKRRLEHALAEIRDSGLVGVHAMGMGDDTLALYEDVELPIRIWAYVSPGTEAAERLKTSGPWGEGRLQVVGVKAFADGALGSRGAYLSEDYSDEPGHRGLEITPSSELAELATALLAQKAQLAVHAIGDAGVRNTLDAFEVARTAHPDIDLPLRVEHAQVVHPDDLPRFKALNAVASMQPTHATSDMPWAEDRLGPHRIGWAYAWKTLREAGALMAFGSDFPVEEHSPSYGLWSAQYRNANAVPYDGWMPEQKLDFATTVGLFSEGTYDALGLDGGVIRVGDPADLTLWTMTERNMGLWFTASATLVDGAVD